MAVNQTEVQRVPVDNAQIDGTGLPVRVVNAAEFPGGAGATGGLTDTQLRATAVPVSEASAAAIKTAVEKIDDFISGARGLVTEDNSAAILTKLNDILTELGQKTEPANAQHVIVDSGAALTDVQLRANPVPISGTVTITDGSGPVTVDGSVVVSSSALPAGAATDIGLAALLLELQQKTEPTDTQPTLEARPAAGAVTQPDFTTITDTTRNVVLLPANASRRSVHLSNLSDLDIPIREGSIATKTIYSRKLRARSELELEFPACTGAIYGYFCRIPEMPILITERS